jgi:hypothetical protein
LYNQSRDCDDYTRRFFAENMDIEPSQMMPIPFETRVHERLEQPMPPYNGFGTVEDSIGSCKYLVLKPPKKDFIKILEHGNNVLRFVAKMV